MDIAFKKIVTKNYLSFKDVEFDFSQFGNKSLLISGENQDVTGDDCRNGAGKSTLFSALVFAVYGEPLNTLKGSHITNWNAKPSEDVSVNLEVVTDGIKYLINRSLVGRKKGQELHVFKVVEGSENEEITRSTIAETQRLIETEIVPCGKEGFVRCIYLTADQNYNFFKLSKAAKNEFFESLFELTTYSEMYNALHRKTLDENNSLIATSRTIDQLVQNISKLKDERESAKQNQDDIKAAEASVEAAKKSLDSFISSNGLKVDENMRIVFDVSDEYKKIVEEGKALSERSKNGKAAISNVSNEIRALESELSGIDVEIRSAKQQILDLNRSIEFKSKSISGHSNITGILCSDCLPKYKKELNITKLEDEIKENTAEISRITATIPALEAKKPSISDKIKEKMALKDKYQTAVDGFDSKIIDLRAALSEIKNVQSAKQNELDSYKSKVSNAEYQLKILTNSKTQSFDQPIATLEKSLSEYKATYSTQEKTIAEYKALESVLKPENIRKSVVTDMLRELNFRISGYLSKMGSNYTCTFDENFDATFVSSKGKEAEYNNFSSGERMRLGIACCLAFKDFMQVRLNIHSNILSIDEYIDSNLDPLAVNGVMELIRYMVATENICAFIISHRSEVLNSMLDGELHIVKKNDESRIEINLNTIS